MSANDLLPRELGSLQRLRQKFPKRLHSELFDAFTLAKRLLPEGEPCQLEDVASRILETSRPRERHS